MQFARKALLILATAFLPALLFATALDIGILRIVGSPAPIKKIISDSGIYSSALSQVLKENNKISAGGTEISLTNPSIKSAAEKSFSPQIVQDTTEKVIDGVYSWLNGKTAQPNFNVDLNAAKATFAVNAGMAASQRASTLPVCPLRTLPDTTDPLNITCIPRGITPARIGTEVQNDVQNGQGFLDNPVITPDQFKNSGSDQTVFSGQLKNLPTQYQRIKATPVILIILCILAVAAIIFLSVSKRKGLKHVGIIFAVAGVFMLLFAWVLNGVVIHKLIPNIKLDNNALQINVRKLTTETFQSVDKNYWQFGAGYAVLGTLAIGGVTFANRGSKEAEAAVTEPEATTAVKSKKSNSKTSSQKS
jgi:hypothetical protein